jgi:hypothetical protein
MQQNSDGNCPSSIEDQLSEDKPSASFINAISEFLDTDPNDLLLELGYYEQDPLALAI